MECTTLVIAHRLSTVMEADKIMVLNHGCIEQVGTHQELIRQEGLYSSYVNLEFSALKSSKVASF